ncbi:hypothetical protein ACFL21_01685 [Patescibacteria group bacterium]
MSAIEASNIGVAYTSPEDKDYRSYVQYLKMYNTALQRKVQAVLDEQLTPGMQQNSLIVTPGSDGRLEKGPQSEMELMVLSFNPLLIDEVSQVIRDQIERVLSPNTKFEHVDPQLIDQKSVTYFEGQINNPRPSRIMDANPICGNEELLKSATQFLTRELIGDNGKKVLRTLVRRVKKARQTCKTGMNKFRKKEFRHFDLEQGIVNYQPDQNVEGFKQGPLRLVQSLIIKEIVHLIRNNPKYQTLLDDLPKNTMDRLFYLFVEELLKLNYSEVEELAQLYSYFLYEYHKSQHEYIKTGGTIMVFDTIEIQERIADIMKLIRGGIVRK